MFETFNIAQAFIILYAIVLVSIIVFIIVNLMSSLQIYPEKSEQRY